MQPFAEELCFLIFNRGSIIFSMLFAFSFEAAAKIMVPCNLILIMEIS